MRNMNPTIGNTIALSFEVLCMAVSPLMLLSYMPEKWQERYVERVWDKKKLHEIRSAYFDSCEWIELSYGEYMKSETLDKIASECIARLRDRIWPQIEKRGMKGRLS